MFQATVFTLSVFTYSDEINIIIAGFVPRNAQAWSNIGIEPKLLS